VSVLWSSIGAGLASVRVSVSRSCASSASKSETATGASRRFGLAAGDFFAAAFFFTAGFRDARHGRTFEMRGGAVAS
jgi:hypothetical protein